MTAQRPLLDFAEDLSFRVDSFSVPDAARGEFDAAMRRNLVFIQELAGFRGHVVLDKSGGPTAFNVVTIAAWQSRSAHEAAGEAVRAHYERTRFDLAAALARWGVVAELGNFAPRSLP
jgi:heme-degrading monooxygenase HmoA